MEQAESKISTPWHVWVVGGLLLIWSGFGVFDYIATVIRYEPHLSRFPEEALDYYFNAPVWMYAMWGISVFGGFFGAAFILMRNKLAVPFFGAGWICSVIAGVYSFVNPPPIEGAGGMFIGIVLAVSLLFLIYVVWLKRRGVLR